MLVLSPDNAEGYLRTKGWIPPGPIQIEPLGWGVSNLVLRVSTAQHTFVLKQSRPQLRTRDPWYSDLDRVYREQEVMEALTPILPPLTVPEVLHVDRPNYVLVMSHAPADAAVWKKALLAGRLDPAVAERAGTVLGRMHEATASNPTLIKRFSDKTVFFQLRVDPYYRRVQERCPEVAEAVEPLVQDLLTSREALCHGDYSPKNILVHQQGFMLVDYETAHFGDPTMDLGFFLSHLVLKAARRAERRAEFFELSRAFWRGYAQEVSFRPLVELEARGVGHCAVCLLARIDGTSPVEYLPQEPKREAMRNIGRAWLRQNPTSWQAALQVVDAELAKLV
jgi:5-methylthioribose kinase